MTRPPTLVLAAALRWPAPKSQANEPLAIQPYRPGTQRARAGGSSRPDAGRSASATSERMDATAGRDRHLFASIALAAVLLATPAQAATITVFSSSGLAAVGLADPVVIAPAGVGADIVSAVSGDPWVVGALTLVVALCVFEVICGGDGDTVSLPPGEPGELPAPVPLPPALPMLAAACAALWGWRRWGPA